MSFTPWMKVVECATKNVVYQFSALCTGVDPTLVRLGPIRCQFLFIQTHKTPANATLYVGNSDVSTTNHGTMLTALQSITLDSGDSNLIRLDQIYLMSDTDNTDVHVIFITR